MSSLFDDSFLTGLQPAEDGPPPPPEDHAPEAVPEGLFEGVYDAPPPPRDGYYRDGHARPVIDSAALLDGLNTEQRAAVVHAGSPLLIVAGAGSGKTRVLTHRIAHLLAERGTHPGQILAITFTNKAAGEMKERVEQLVGPRANAMWVMTFHSACVRILRRESKKLGFTSSFSIYDAADSKRLMALVCRDLDLDPKQFPPKSFTAKVSNLKNELIDEETFAGQAADGFEKTLAQAYALYQARLREANALDFDDIIMTTVHLLQAFPDVAEHYRRRFRHVLVDEYQDTNHAQYTLVRELVGPAGEADAPAELCVVGDADQSIYAFRGATIRNILQFEEDYPSATTILLEQNYRSTQTILSAANAVIERNESRRPKNLWTNAAAAPASPATSPTPSTTRRSSSPTRSTGSPTRATPRRATSPSSTGPTPSPVSSKRSSSASACPTRSSAACASTSARRSGTSWPTSGSSPTPRTPSRCAASSTSPSAASATAPKP